MTEENVDKRKGRRKKKRDPLDPANVVKARRDYIDYDYADKLTEEERQWLSRFTDEFYGADFQINDTYIKENGKYVQISGNKDKSKNRDLRKHRHVTKYYKKENGRYTTDPQYKYSPETLHNTEELRLECNRASNAIERNMFRSVRQSVGSSGVNNMIEEVFGTDNSDPEQELIAKESVDDMTIVQLVASIIFKDEDEE